MILVDPRSGAESQDKQTTVDRLVQHIRNIGVPCDKGPLEFADIAFEGNGPQGRVMIGIERKTVHDMLHCIDDARYAAHQKPGMHVMYARCFVALEGIWKAHDPGGWLMESQNGCQWYYCKYRSKPVLYSKLYRYLMSIALSGVIITPSRNLWETAYHTCELYQYFQKRWEDHTSLLETQKLLIPDLRGKPPLVRRWAAELDNIGVKYSMRAEELFKKPITLARATEMDWMQIDGIGRGTAQKIIKEVWGWD